MPGSGTTRYHYYNYIDLSGSWIETPQRTFGVENYSTANGSQFKYSLDLYDDHGNLLLSQYWDYNRGVYVPRIYGYDNYDQLTWLKDANGNQTTYQSDEWGRLKN